MESSNNPCKNKGHDWENFGHEITGGRGMFGTHYHCKKDGCRFNNDAWLHKNIKGDCYK